MTDIAIWITAIPLILGLIKTGHYYAYGNKSIKDNWLGWILIIAGLVLLTLFMGNILQYQYLI